MDKQTTTSAAPIYRCEGSFRGCCGVDHRTITGAARCVLRDASGCKAQGGYSDRSISEYVNGERTGRGVMAYHDTPPGGRPGAVAELFDRHGETVEVQWL